MSWIPGQPAGPRGQVAHVVNIMRTSTQFSNESSGPALGQPLGTEGGDAGVLRLTGGLYTQYRVTPELHIGLGVNGPFGLRTVYDGEWMGRFQAQKSTSQAHNFNPSVAYKVHDHFSIGGGVNFQRFEAKLSNAVNYTAAVVSAALAAGAIVPAAVPALVTPGVPGNIAGLEGTAQVSGDDWGYGWNLGFLYKPSNDFSFGAHYRSKVRYTLEGDVEFTAPSTTVPLGAAFIAALGAPGGPLAAGPVQAKATLPDSFSVSSVIRVQPKVDLLLDATWFGWSTLTEIVFNRDNGAVLSRLNFQWRDTWRLAAGATYHYSPAMQFRAGYAWDETVIDDERTRSPRLPDSTRHWFSVGSRHMLSDKLTLDLAANFVKANTARIPMRSDPSAAAAGVLDGRYRTNSLTLSAQASYAFH
jgi:long-chain fatty acid transport protein